jgi:predicted GTPase
MNMQPLPPGDADDPGVVATRSGFVALAGRPNVGKSTLTNAIVGAKVAIVSDKPQTTRRAIRGVATTPDYQLVLVDLPGVQRPMDARRIDEHQLPVVIGLDPDDARARRLRLVGDDRHLGTDQAVEQGRLPRVWAADEGDVAGAEHKADYSGFMGSWGS